MNKSIPMHSKNGRSFHDLANDIREKFLAEPDPAGDSPAVSGFRVALYSHDTMGIGHMRRNILIASHIKKNIQDSAVLVLAGAKEAASFAHNAGIDCMTLPSFLKQNDGTYSSRNLNIPADEILELRSQSILASMKCYKPDLFIVDKIPSGAGGELLPTLQWLKSNTDCSCVVGLREILDTPEKVSSDWTACGCLRLYGNIFIASGFTATGKSTTQQPSTTFRPTSST